MTETSQSSSADPLKARSDEISLFPLTEVELAGGMVLGYEDAPPLEPHRAGTLTPRQALEAAIEAGLRKPPCVVTFSGGRDSSALLALAVQVARREGLDLPIPVTLNIADSSEADEGEWQEIVIGHLGIEDWVRIRIDEQLDIVGEVATLALSRHGLLWPFNTHFHIPMLAEATGGSLITGFGGDEVAMSSSTARAERVIARRRPSDLTDILAVGLALSPQRLRTQVYLRREYRLLSARPWLSQTGLERVAREAAKAQSNMPLGWSQVLRNAIWRARYFRVCRRSFEVVGAAMGVKVIHPFVDPDVLVALAAYGGFKGLGDRTSLMEVLFGDLLPEKTISRGSKAIFDDAMWTPASREFARSWSGRGLPEALVDADRLRQHWLSPRPHALSATLMQAAWLFDHKLK